MDINETINKIKNRITNRFYENDTEFLHLIDELKKIADDSNDLDFRLDLYAYIKVKKAFLLLSQGKYEKVQLLLDENIAYALQSNNKQVLISSYNLAALLNYNIAEYTKSLRYFNSALELAIEINDGLNTCNIQNNIGDLFARFNEFDIAINYFIEANQFLKDKLDNDEYTNISVINVYNIVTTYIELGSYDLAQSYFNILNTVIKNKDMSSLAVLSAALSIAVNVNITGQMDEVYRQYQLIINTPNSLSNDTLNLFDGYTLAVKSFMKINHQEETEKLLDLMLEIVKMLNTNRVFLSYYDLVINYLVKFKPNDFETINKYYKLFYQTSINDLVKNDENVANALNVELRINETRLQHLEMVKKNDELYRLSNTDSLTSLYNRHYLENELARIFQIKDINISLIIFDIDKFKDINDNFGHVQGDYIIISAANIITPENEDNVNVFRYGGDEFVTIIINKDEEFTLNYIKKIQSKLSLDSNRLEKDKFTFSIGYDFSNTSKTNQVDIINNADKALYQAKNDGRNTFKKYLEL